MGMASANPAAGLVGCPSGWDQLLPPSQRARALEARGCSASAQAPAALADQLSIYALPVTHGPLGQPTRPAAGFADAMPIDAQVRKSTAHARGAGPRPAVARGRSLRSRTGIHLCWWLRRRVLMTHLAVS